MKEKTKDKWMFHLFLLHVSKYERIVNFEWKKWAIWQIRSPTQMKTHSHLQLYSSLWHIWDQINANK